MAAHFLSELISFLDGLPEPRIVMNADYRIIAANAAYIREFGAGKSITGRCCYEVSHHFDVPCDQAGESCPLKLSLEAGAPQRVLHLHHTPRGEEHVDVQTTPIRDGAGQIAYFVETMRVVRQASSRPAAQGLVGRSPAFIGMLEKVLRVANSNAAVLLLGETGTGKELVAHAIHEASAREDGPFVAVDCAGMTETLFESELFGYEKGAFTGATHRKQGLVEAASGGTLFLDEIGELPLALQVKLLRLLETGTYRRVGGLDWLPVDFRLIAATHRDLRAMVQAESFRRDLYFRINTFPIRTPALHERASDIPLLAASLLERVDRKTGRHFSPAALDWLSTRRYAGNIRELRNLIERATLMADGDTVDLPHLSEMDDDVPAVLPASGDVFQLEQVVALADLERRYLAWAKARPGFELPTLAEQLGVSQRTLYRKLQGAAGQASQRGAS
ncbi:sigma 54-interacting transcriptional regulator [Dechloromonas denitrificans]|uniref:sigma-54 interaction domain-containing protein n=1 Tax=Dechloromonas denitrificans TaxID=281362 RepID=UPI001CF857CE|nr:sigma 54-interacting transcriptional regulator [Dechloromonas denitrificans]UCV12319.1 sigma 54-interacting transcriptional regulator [Dechloromonas denitrificans]